MRQLLSLLSPRGNNAFSMGYARGGQLNVTLCYIVTLFAIYYASEGHSETVRQP